MTFDFYKDIHLAQTIGAKELILDISKDFDSIIEIGALHGGLSLYINDNKKEDIEFISFDINLSQLWQGLSPPINSEKINFIVADCFSDIAIKTIGERLSNRKTLLLCDGGNKNHEFNFYSKFMSSGSVIMLHDYIDDTLPEYWEVLTKHKDWRAPPESRYSAIREKVKEYKLLPYRYDELLEVFWGGFIKP
jgi:cephalosporin hydroxylase